MMKPNILRPMHLVVAAFALTLTLPAMLSCSKSNETRSKVLVDADSTLEYAIALYDDAEYEKSLDMARLALGVYLRHDDKGMAGDCYAQMAACYQRLGDVDSGISNTIKCMRLDEQLGDLERLSSTYNNLAALYITADRPREGLPFILKSINIENSLDSSPKLSIRYGIAAETYLKLHQTDSALSFATRALELDRRAHDTIKIARRLSVLGDVYAAKNLTDKAVEYYNQAIDLLMKHDEPTSLMITQQHLGKVLLDRGEYDRAVKSLEQSTQLAEQAGAKLVLQRNYTYLAQALKHTNPSRAVDYMALSVELNDTINQRETATLTARYAAQFETKDKELTIEKQAKQLQRQRYVMAAIIAVALIMLLACIALYYIMRLKAKAQRQAGRIERERQEIFTGVTHAFRTPLTVILGHANALKEQITSAGQSRAVTAIIDQGNAMLEMVSNLLDISQLTERNTRDSWRHGNVVQLARLALEPILQDAAEHHVTVDFAPESNDIAMDFVPQYITGIVTNVITTAIEFAPRGSKVISTMSAKGGELLFSTIVGGEGITDRHFERLLDDERALTDDDRTGIVLTLVRQMTAAMNGRLDVMTIKEQGTVITVGLPLEHATGGFPKWIPDIMLDSDPVVITTDDAMNDDGRNDKPVALVVEDNSDVARYIESVLAPRFAVMHAANGHEGLDKAREYQPAVIVTDLMMPVMDGVELCKRLRQEHDTALTPVIMVTARVGAGDSISALTAGADAVLHKPFDDKLLLATIDRLLQVRQALDRRRDNEAPLAGNDADTAFLTALSNAVTQAIADPELGSAMLADKLCLSQRQLNRKVKALTDNDTATYIRLARVALAKRLLAATDLQVADIVVKCGFDSPSYFAKVFKQTAGMTPSEYRKNHRSTL